jgi:predicted dehydrogenase
MDLKPLRNGPVTAVLCGAGNRGRDAYGNYALHNPQRLKFIAIADPNTVHRHLFQKEHQIPNNLAFNSWEDLLNSTIGKIADAAFICTPDLLHYTPTMRALELGYDLVLEKPISASIDECRSITRLAQEKGRLVQVCHVLRFTAFWRKVKEIVDSGRIGRVIHYDHSENVAYWHMGHSFVRGLYKNKETSSPMILAKCCHDLDLMTWILKDKPLMVQSYGDLTHYRPENQPKDAPLRCTDGCPHSESCPWYAPRTYISGVPLLQTGLHAKSKALRWSAKLILDHPKFVLFLEFFDKRANALRNWKLFPATHVTTDLSIDGKMKALREGPYGLCIYRAGNDVVDHQISTVIFPGGVTGTLTMHGLSDFEGRELRIFGTKGALRGIFRFGNERIEVTDFRYSHTDVVHKGSLNLEAGHGGGDWGLMDAFTAVMLGEQTPEQAGTTDVIGAMESHYMAFAIEDARATQQNIKMEKYRT